MRKVGEAVYVSILAPNTLWSKDRILESAMNWNILVVALKKLK